MKNQREPSVGDTSRQVSKTWTTWILTDIRGSLEGLAGTSPKELQKYRERRSTHLAALEEMVDEAGATSSHAEKDNLSATFDDPYRAIQTAKKISRYGREKRGEFSDRVGMHISSGEGIAGGDYNEGAALATRIMDLCPAGYIICSEDLLDHLTPPKRSRLEAEGPFIAKLKGPIRPVTVYAIPDEGGPRTPVEIPLWQTPPSKSKKEYNDLGRLRRQPKEAEEKHRAASAADRIWRRSRDQGYYLLGDLAFAILYQIGRSRGKIRLQVEASRGRGDVNMARRHKQTALKWAKRARQLTAPSKVPFDRAFYIYQAAHILAHCGAPQYAERSLLKAYEKFEKLEAPRMAGWAMFSAARCARFRDDYPAAEDRILASLVIFASSPGERPIAYALMEMMRLRAAQDNLAAAAWYRKRALTLYPNVVNKALGDAVGEPTSRSIQDRIEAAGLSGKEPVEDPARRLVEITVAQAFPAPQDT